MRIDFTSDHGIRVLNELATQPVIWLTTLGSGNRPQPNLVWFVYNNGDLIVYSQPDAKRLEHMKQNPRVSLNFNSDPEGHQQSVLLGNIAEDSTLPAVIDNPDYLEKYEDRITTMGGTAKSFSEDYSVRLRIELIAMRGF